MKIPDWTNFKFVKDGKHEIEFVSRSTNIKNITSWTFSFTKKSFYIPRFLGIFWEFFVNENTKETVSQTVWNQSNLI